MSKEKTIERKAHLNNTSSFFLFIIMGLAIFLPSMPYSEAIADAFEIALRLTLITVTLGCYYYLKRNDRLSDQAMLFLAFAVAAFGMTLSWQYGNFLLHAFDGDIQSMRGIALAKAGSSVMTLLPITLMLLLLKRRGFDVYLSLMRRGFISLLIGTVAFFGFGMAAYGSFFADRDALQHFQSALPWILVFVFANALMEELLFRGLFLSIATKVMGIHYAALATALVFAAAHLTITYTSDVPVFLVILVGLGLVWAYLMIWSRSLWGSVVFHAGADLMILGGILQSMQ